MSKKVKFEVGSDNIFIDLGFPDAEMRLLKARIVSEIFHLATLRKTTQTQTAKALGISQPEVSRMFHGHFQEYSVERLMNFLTALGRDVEIVSRPHRGTTKPGKITFRPVAA